MNSETFTLLIETAEQKKSQNQYRASPTHEKRSERSKTKAESPLINMSYGKDASLQVKWRGKSGSRMITFNKIISRVMLDTFTIID